MPITVVNAVSPCMLATLIIAFILGDRSFATVTIKPC